MKAKCEGPTCPLPVRTKAEKAELRQRALAKAILDDKPETSSNVIGWAGTAAAFEHAYLVRIERLAQKLARSVLR